MSVITFRGLPIVAQIGLPLLAVVLSLCAALSAVHAVGAHQARVALLDREPEVMEMAASVAAVDGLVSFLSDTKTAFSGNIPNAANWILRSNFVGLAEKTIDLADEVKSISYTSNPTSSGAIDDANSVWQTTQYIANLAHSVSTAVIDMGSIGAEEYRPSTRGDPDSMLRVMSTMSDWAELQVNREALHKLGSTASEACEQFSTMEWSGEYEDEYGTETWRLDSEVMSYVETAQVVADDVSKITPESQTEVKEEKTLSTGAIIGIAGGAVVFLALIAGSIVLFTRRKGKNAEAHQELNEM